MHVEGYTHESHNEAPNHDSIGSQPQSQPLGPMSHQDHAGEDDKQYLALSEGRSYGSVEDNDDTSSKGSHKSFEEHLQPEKQPKRSLDENRFSRNSNPLGEQHHQSHVHFRERASTFQSPAHAANLPPLSPTTAATKPRTYSSQLSDESTPQQSPHEDLARSSWTTASFTEVPGALDELTHQQHSSKTHQDTYVHVIPPSEQGSKKSLSKERNSVTDLHTILAKHGEQHHGSILTKYLRPTMSDEGTQAGIPAWDWLTRLEQMLIHFFLMVFESSNDSSKLIMEMMSTEAGAQIEEIFQLLLKAEPEMYKELGHLVTLAEKWLIHWRGDSEERQKALEYVRLYMQGVKDKNYYMLPVQVRLHKLGTFIAGLKVMGKDDQQLPPVRFPSYKVYRVSSNPENQLRVGSPRVKPATHFSQVVANILSGRPCNDPLPKPTVYADKLGINVFKNALHGDKEFKTYTDKKYGKLFQKRELFVKDYPRTDSLEMFAASGDGEVKVPEREECVENTHCWIPKYTKSYVQTLQDEGCEVLAKADYEKGIKVKEWRQAHGKGQVHVELRKTTVKPQKLYDWVRGPDGKVHRRVVGSYTELGGVASMGRLGTKDRMTGRRGPGGRFGKKGLKGEAYPKAVSDTRLGRHSYDTRKTQTTRYSKSRYTSRSRSKSKDRFAKDVSSRKSKKTGAPVLNAYKIEGISIDGSGDSGQEDVIKRDKNKGTSTDVKIGVSAKKSNKSKGESIKVGASSQYKPHSQSRGTNKDVSKTDRGVGGATSGSYSRRTHGTQAGASGDGKHGSFVSIFDKKHGKNADQMRSRRTLKSLKRSQYSVTDEWGGEGYWSPRDSDIFSNLDKDEDYKREKEHLLSINQCWEKASKLLKKPSKALVFPPAENLMLYLEKKYPRSKWPRGDPIATRNYPNGSVFVAQYRNGSSKVYYPHGGLAVAISAPSPVSSQILIIRDPSDQVFFFDKALLAELNSAGEGTIYAEDGVIKAQYSAIGGFKLDNLEKSQRWHWNNGGQRIVLRLNNFLSLRISDQDKIFLICQGYKRGFNVNVASGHEVILMNPTSESTRVDPIMRELKKLIRPKTMEDTFDIIRGKSKPRPTLGFVDKAKHYTNVDENLLPLMESDKRQENNNKAYQDHGRNGIGGFFSRNYDGRSVVNNMDNFPNYGAVNRDCCIVNTFPVACYNTMF